MLGEHTEMALSHDEELKMVRWQLTRMIERRLVAPLSPGEQERYRRLARREHELLEGRVVALDASDGSQSAMEATPRSDRYLPAR